MKAKYTKPVLVMEHFTLSQSIAHNCGDLLEWDDATMKSKRDCGWKTGFDIDADGKEDILFVSSDVCSYISEDFAGICYNNPEGGFNVFNS